MQVTLYGGPHDGNVIDIDKRGMHRGLILKLVDPASAEKVVPGKLDPDDAAEVSFSLYEVDRFLGHRDAFGNMVITGAKATHVG